MTPLRHPKTPYFFLAVGFLLRLVYVLYIQPLDQALFSDMNGYKSIAEAIEQDIWKVTHFFQPIGFPYLILLFKQFTDQWMTPLAIFQVFLNTFSLWFVWRASLESFGEKIALASLSLGVFHFPWIIYSGLNLAESAFIFFLASLSWLTVRLVRTNEIKYAIAWAIAFIIGFWFKGTHVFLGPLFLLCMLFIYRKKAIRNILLPIIPIVAIGLLAHGLFTLEKIGKFQMSASAGGLNFVEGKCELKNNADNSGYSWLSPLYFQLDLMKQKKWDRPFTDSKYFMEQGFKCIVENPFTLIQSLEGIPFLFVGNTLWPANQFRFAALSRLYELFFGVFSIAGLILYFRSFFPLREFRPKEFTAWVVPILTVFLTVYIFKSEMRFRVPFDVWIIPVSMKGWWSLIHPRELLHPRLQAMLDSH